MAKGFVDLGREYSCGPCDVASNPSPKKSVSFPTLFLSGVQDLPLSIGEFSFTAKGRVISVTERKSDKNEVGYSCEIEVHAIRPDGGEGASGGLKGALDDIAGKKYKK